MLVLKGAVVVGLSITEASEIFDFRCIIDSHVIRVAVPHMTPALIEEARAICAAFGSSSDIMDWGNLNRAFHLTLYQASNLPFHLGTLTNAMDRLDRYVRAQLVLSEGHARANAEHLEILEACARGDADGRELAQGARGVGCSCFCSWLRHTRGGCESK